jgi:hypothetical protein
MHRFRETHAQSGFPLGDIFPWKNACTSKMGEVTMGTCEVCGNQYDKAFEVSVAGGKHTFDSFECAIHALAPTCNHCGCRIVGHGVEGKAGVMFCSANCAKQEGVSGLQDRAS